MSMVSFAPTSFCQSLYAGAPNAQTDCHRVAANDFSPVFQGRDELHQQDPRRFSDA